VHTFRFASELPHPRADAWAWHLRPGALARLTPPWQEVRVGRDEGVRLNGRTELVITRGPLRLHWTALHDAFEAGRSFRDVQESGPFASWSHEHLVEDTPAGCRWSDQIAWEPGWWMPTGAVEADLQRVFAWRHRRLREDLDRHAAAGLPPMRIALSGGSGLVGGALAAFLSTGGHQVVPIRRGVAPGDGHIAWDGAGVIDAGRLRACDAVIHLAGAGVAERRWDAAWMRTIRDSRVLGTGAIAQALAADPGQVRTLVCAGGAGWYGDRGEDLLDESSTPGTGFLADVCRDWEAACDPVRARVRTVNLRTGVVLSARGGALARLLPSARLGLAGPLGDGRQWWPWIALDDLVHTVLHALARPGLSGPMNAVTGAVRQADLARAVAAAVGRPALAPPAPRSVLRLGLGRMVDEVLLASARVEPGRLRAGGFRWQHPDLLAALAWELGRD
jgi:uncharacterized protein (TIGR01777 family)